MGYYCAHPDESSLLPNVVKVNGFTGQIMETRVKLSSDNYFFLTTQFKTYTAKVVAGCLTLGWRQQCVPTFDDVRVGNPLTLALLNATRHLSILTPEVSSTDGRCESWG